MQNEILIVDDEPETREILKYSLSKSNCRVTTAADGLEALDQIKSHRFDIVITDIRMPNKTGMEVLEEVKRRSPSTDVILMTAYAGLDNAIAALKGGASDYIQKPFTLDEMERVVFKFIRTNEPPQPLPEIPFYTRNEKMKKILEVAKNAANSNLPVLIIGESGTGKEVLSRSIHEMSDRRHQPFVGLNCAALPHGLLESELFGYEKGAFTGAVERKMGRFEQANGGTLLLDEISEMELGLQSKLLRVLQEYEIDRLGGKKPIKVDVRVIATSNRDLKAKTERGEFREDLYYRLNAVNLKIPPLRERPEDVALITEKVLEEYGATHRKRVVISDEALQILKQLYWRGNVRELKNTVQRAILLSGEKTIEIEHLQLESETERADVVPQGAFGATLEEMEQAIILKTLKERRGNRTHTAKILGISIRTLRNKLRQYRASGQLLPMAGG